MHTALDILTSFILTQSGISTTADATRAPAKQPASSKRSVPAAPSSAELVTFGEVYLEVMDGERSPAFWRDPIELRLRHLVAPISALWPELWLCHNGMRRTSGCRPD